MAHDEEHVRMKPPESSLVSDASVCVELGELVVEEIFHTCGASSAVASGLD